MCVLGGAATAPRKADSELRDLDFPAKHLRQKTIASNTTSSTTQNEQTQWLGWHCQKRARYGDGAFRTATNGRELIEEQERIARVIDLSRVAIH